VKKFSNPESAPVAKFHSFNMSQQYSPCMSYSTPLLNSHTLSLLSFFGSFLTDASVELDVLAWEAADAEVDFFECDESLSLLRDDFWSSSPDELERSPDGCLQKTTHFIHFTRMSMTKKRQSNQTCWKVEDNLQSIAFSHLHALA